MNNSITDKCSRLEAASPGGIDRLLNGQSGLEPRQQADLPSSVHLRSNLPFHDTKNQAQENVYTVTSHSLLVNIYTFSISIKRMQRHKLKTRAVL
jgi:hypothetical protein